MSKQNTVSRRGFLRTAAMAAGTVPFLLPSHVWSAEVGANDRIVMGCIGLGTQGRGLLGGWLGNKEVQVVAISEVDTFRREHIKKSIEERYAKNNDTTYKGCEAYPDFRELIARKDINAVCIATPDHWHAIPVIMAANAKKDIYCEKPLSLTIGEARAMANAVRKNNRVFQTGSMQRSSKEFLKACELVRNGKIGKVKEIYVSVGDSSKWCDLPEEELEPGLDWDMWLGPAPKRPYNSVLAPRRIKKPDGTVTPHTHFPSWRNYREYSGGMMTDWGAHHFDIAQWGMGMDESGPVEILPPDQEHKKIRYKYANGTIMYHGGLPGYSYGVVFVGENGKVCVDRGKFKVEPEEIAADYAVGSLPIKLYNSSNHQKDFITCMRSRQKPICDVEVGARSVSVCHLGNFAYWNKRALKWDPAKEQFIGDDEANTWINRKNRAPWDKAV